MKVKVRKGFKPEKHNTNIVFVEKKALSVTLTLDGSRVHDFFNALKYALWPPYSSREVVYQVVHNYANTLVIQFEVAVDREQDLREFLELYCKTYELNFSFREEVGHMPGLQRVGRRLISALIQVLQKQQLEMRRSRKVVTVKEAVLLSVELCKTGRASYRIFAKDKLWYTVYIEAVPKTAGLYFTVHRIEGTQVFGKEDPSLSEKMNEMMKKYM